MPGQMRLLLVTFRFKKLMGDISVARPIFYIVNACDDNVSEEESANSASCSHFLIMKIMWRRPKQTLTYSWKI